jgi:hypothetical protein
MHIGSWEVFSKDNLQLLHSVYAPPMICCVSFSSFVFYPEADIGEHEADTILQ